MNIKGGIEFICESNELRLFMEMGTGKTKTTIDNIGYLNLKKQLKAALIIAPKSVYSVWKKD